MVIDASAQLAILKVEPEAVALIDRLSQAGPRRPCLPAQEMRAKMSPTRAFDSNPTRPWPLAAIGHWPRRASPTSTPVPEPPLTRFSAPQFHPSQA